MPGAKSDHEMKFYYDDEGHMPIPPSQADSAPRSRSKSVIVELKPPASRMLAAFSCVADSGISALQQGFRLIFHIREFAQAASVQGRSCTLSCAAKRIAVERCRGSIRPLAPNPVTGLWSGCTRLHSKQIHFRVFR